MRILEKLLLLLLVLLLAVAGVGAIAMCFLPEQEFIMQLNWLLGIWFANRWLVLIAGGVLLLLAILMLFGVVFARSAKGEEAHTANVVKVGEGDSNVQISTAAVDCIIQQQKLNFPALQALESKIIDGADGAQVILKITASADANMQQLSAALQDSVKMQLQDMVGMRVATVKVIIAEVTAGAPA